MATSGLGYAFYVAIILCLSQTLAVSDRYLLGLVLELLKKDMQLSDTQLALLHGPSFVLLFALVSLPVGRLADLKSRKWIIVAGMLLWTTATVACGLARNFGELFAARMLVGVGEAALIPSAMSMVVAYFPRRLLNRGVSIVAAGGPLGHAAAFLGGGAMLGAFTLMTMPPLGVSRPWQALFVAFGLMGFAMVAVVVLSIREPARTVIAGEAKATFGEGFAYFWNNRGVYVPLLVAFSMVSVIVAAIAAWSISLFVRQHGMSPASAGALLGICTLAVGPFGNVFGGFLIDFLSARGVRAPHLLVLGGLLIGATLGGVVFWLAPTVAIASAAYVFLYFCAMLSGASGYGGVQSVTPDRYRAVMASIALSTQVMIGAGLGPVVVGALSDAGLPSLGASMFAAFALATAIGAPTVLLNRRRFEAARQAQIALAPGGAVAGR